MWNLLVEAYYGYHHLSGSPLPDLVVVGEHHATIVLAVEGP